MANSHITISELGPKGDGIADTPHGRIYVEGGVPGDELFVSAREDMHGVVRGKIINVVKRSPHRQEPPCPNYEACGNCTLQHVNETFYRDWKSEVVKSTLTKYRVKVGEYLPPIFIGEGNRRRATFSAYKERGRVHVGYYRRRSQEIIDIDECLVADPKLLQIRQELIPYLRDNLRENSVVDVFVQLVGDKVDVVFIDEDNDANDEPLKMKFGELNITLPPQAFLQPTAAGEKALIEAVMKNLPAEGKFADLFSGCGTFTGPMLSRGPVDAYESDASAVHALKVTKHPNLGVYRRDLFTHPLFAGELNAYAAVVFDPPRAGCPEQAAMLAQSKVPILIGVSCNPATFARDASLLKKGGYRLETVQIIDQFLYSHHVEIVGRFRKT